MGLVKKSALDLSSVADLANYLASHGADALHFVASTAASHPVSALLHVLGVGTGWRAAQNKAAAALLNSGGTALHGEVAGSVGRVVGSGGNAPAGDFANTFLSSFPSGFVASLQGRIRKSLERAGKATGKPELFDVRNFASDEVQRNLLVDMALGNYKGVDVDRVLSDRLYRERFLGMLHAVDGRLASFMGSLADRAAGGSKYGRHAFSSALARLTAARRSTPLGRALIDGRDVAMESARGAVAEHRASGVTGKASTKVKVMATQAARNVAGKAAERVARFPADVLNMLFNPFAGLAGVLGDAVSGAWGVAKGMYRAGKGVVGLVGDQFGKETGHIADRSSTIREASHAAEGVGNWLKNKLGVLHLDNVVKSNFRSGYGGGDVVGVGTRFLPDSIGKAVDGAYYGMFSGNGGLDAARCLDAFHMGRALRHLEGKYGNWIKSGTGA